MNFEGFFENLSGSCNISIYKKDTLGGININQQVFTTSVAKNLFALGVIEEQKNYTQVTVVLDQVINYDGMIDFSADMMNTSPPITIQIDGKQVAYINRNDSNYTKTWRGKIKAGQRLKVTAQSGVQVKDFHCRVIPKQSPATRIPIEATLEANTAYYVVIDSNFVVKTLKEYTYNYNYNDSGTEVTRARLSPGAGEIEIVNKGNYSKSGKVTLWEGTSFLSMQDMSLSQNQKIVIPFIADSYEELYMKLRFDRSYLVVSYIPKELHLSTQSISNLIQSRGFPCIGVEFEKPAPIKVILNKSVLHLENKNFIPGETYYLHKDELYTLEELQKMGQNANLSKF